MKKGYGANHTLLWKTRETSSVKKKIFYNFLSTLQTFRS